MTAQQFEDGINSILDATPPRGVNGSAGITKAILKQMVGVMGNLFSHKDLNGLNVDNGGNPTYFTFKKNGINQFNIYTNGDTENRLRLASYNDAGAYIGEVFNINRTNRNVTLHSNLGIGTENPISRFHINSTSAVDTLAVFGHNSGATLIGHTGANEGIISGYTATNIKFGHSYVWGFVETMRLNSTGNLLLGTAVDNGSDKLQVNGSALINGDHTIFGNSSRFYLKSTSGTGYSTFFENKADGSNQFNINIGGFNVFGHKVLGSLAGTYMSAYEDLIFTTWTGNPTVDDVRVVIKKHGGVGMGTITPNPSAALDITSNTRGFLPPRMTSAQRAAISSPAEGLMVYQTDGTKGWYGYNGSAWVTL
jgi:hypothetical protein